MGDRASEYLRRAEDRLPGVLYSFNIADLKRRNGHLGHVVGDADVAELGSMLAALEPRVVVARVRSERWLLLAPGGAEEASSRREVETVLAAFARAEPLVVGWEVSALKDGQSRVGREVVASRIRRAVRCLYAHVRTRAELEEAIARIDENDYALPVDRPVALEDVEAIGRHPWRCVEEYPERSPSCPFCDARDVEWADGDGSVYGGDGACKGCGASLSFRDVSQVPADPRIARARADAEVMLRFLEERVTAGECAEAILRVEAVIEYDAEDEQAIRSAAVFVTKADGTGDTYKFSGTPEALASSFARRVGPSRAAPDEREREALRSEMREMRERASEHAARSTPAAAVPSDARDRLARIERGLAERVARSPRPDAIATAVRAGVRVRWRLVSDLRSRLERTDVAISAEVQHRLPARDVPTRLYGEELSRADLEDRAGAERDFRDWPTPEDLDALVADALVAKPW